MNGRGAVEIIVAEIALAAGLIDTTVFSILVFMAIFTTATVPILLTRAVRALEKRGELVADDRSGTVIIGAGPTARHMAHLLGSESTVLVDSNADHCATADSEGLSVVKGNALDEDVLARAGANEAAALLCMTPNGEANLIAARIARTRFGVPLTLVAMPPSTTNGMTSMLADIGAEPLFGRTIDLESWDRDTEIGRTSDLRYTVADPEDVVAQGRPIQPEAAAMESLPMVVQSGSGTEPFHEDQVLEVGAQVIGLGRRQTTGPDVHTRRTDDDSIRR